MVDAVLLDWEGVLADTGPARRDALLRVLADEGVPCTVAAYDDCCGGLDVHAAAIAALAVAGRHDPTLAELIALRASRQFAEQLTRGFTLAPGAASFIAAAEPATRLAVVTRARRPETELALRLSGLDGSFATVVTSDDVLDQPPAPALHAHAVELLSRRRAVQRTRAVAMASATPVVRGARAAGLRTIAVAAPAHVALEADAAVDGLDGLTVDAMAKLLRMHPSAAQP
jgi:beta-phosphoglucomutase-like phosphatase (HAD superfamily)